MFTIDSKANSRITDPSANQPITFTFPSSLDSNLTFASIADIHNFVAEEERRLSDPSLRNLFRYTYKPNQQRCERVRMHCKYCHAHINFRKENDVFRLSHDGIRQHEHHNNKLTNCKTDASIFEVFREKTKLKQNLWRLKTSILKQYAITKTHFEQLMRRFEEEELSSFNHLRSIMEDASMEFKYDWGSDLEERYPRLIVAVTPAMKNNYLKYCDFLVFEFTDNAIRNKTADEQRYKLAVFCVIDTNLRVLLTALAFMCERSTQTIRRAFEMFFELHQSVAQPETIQTTPELDMVQAIIELQSNKVNRLYSFHVFDPYYIVEDIQKSLKGDPNKNKLVMRAFVRMIRARTQKEFAECIHEIKGNCEDVKALSHWMEEAVISRYAYFLLPARFVGVRRFFNQRPKTLVEEEVSYEASINTLVDRLVGLDKRLNAKSSDGYRIYSQTIEHQLLDERIKCVRLAFEGRIFERFLENYFKSRAEMRMVEDPKELAFSEKILHVRSKLTEQIFEVSDWVCGCNELTKTGVPCPHLLACAQQIEAKSYVQLFNIRWLKELPESKPKIMWIKRGRAKSSRRNTHKRRIGAGGKGALM